MKKITLFFALLISSIGFSQTIPVDFDDALDVFVPFNGAAFSVIDDGGNNVMQLIGAAHAWDGATIVFANLVDLTDDADNTITFRINVPAGSSNEHLLKFEENLGGAGAATAELTFTTTGTGWQTMTVDYGAGFGKYGKMSVFPDKGDANAGIAVTYLLDDFAGAKSADRPQPATPPTTAAPTPPVRNAWDVISLYSDAYTDIATNFDAGWCGTGSVEEIMIASNATQAYKGNACQGIVFGAAVDASAFTHMHVDVYTTETSLEGKVFNLKFVETVAGGSVLEVNFNTASSPPLEAAKWISIDVAVDLSNFDALKEFGITCNLNSTSWYDNLYFYRAATAGVDKNNLLNVSLTPSPATNELRISAQEVIENVTIYNVLGKSVVNTTINKKEDVINVSGLNTGIYILKYTINNAVGTMKFIKK